MINFTLITLFFDLSGWKATIRRWIFISIKIGSHLKLVTNNIGTMPFQNNTQHIPLYDFNIKCFLEDDDGENVNFNCNSHISLRVVPMK